MSIPATPKKILLGLDFILGHFQEPIFPRKIMTKELGYQVEVFSKEEALGYFKSSNYEDCRINAYPPFTEYQGINRTPISFLMVDLDLKDFGGRVEGGGELEYSKKKEEKTSLSLEKALNKASEKIKKEKVEEGGRSIGGNPTVLWTGNGYHIYQPVSGLILEEYETFYEFTKYLGKDLTSMFIQFAEEYLTDYTADRLHNPTVKSCLLRIPGSLNSKCIPNKVQDAEVKIVQRWDGKRPSIQPLLRDFRRWLIHKRIDDIEELKEQEKKRGRFQIIASQNQSKAITKIKWIEKGILEHPLPDHRKYIIWRILSPYLLNVKKLPKEESYSVMKDWLDRCNELERLNFNAKIKIKEGLKGASKGYFPISIEKLKEENNALYCIVLNRRGKSESVC
ncbi:MAG: DNA primase noncatalytic subunit PriX [Nitrososphaeraceae archaeon]